MMSSMKARWGVMAMSAVVALALFFSPTANTARADDADDDVTGHLTAVWWQWLYSVPLDKNPGFDDTGKFAFENQPFDDVVFLAGTFTSQTVGNDVHGTATRSITVEKGTAFFFPILNSEWDNVVFDAGGPGVAEVVNSQYSVPQLKALAAGVGNATNLYCTLTKAGKGGNTVDVPYSRVKSPVFSYFLPKGNIYEFYGETITGTVRPAVSDGYWSYIPPLSKGTYTLKFGGEAPNNPTSNFYLDITYHITVK